MTIAVGVNTDGRREVLGMAVGAFEAEPFWTEFLRDLVRRGLSGVKLVISDAHEGITARVLSTTWQRCRVHFQRNALAHAGKSSRRVVSAFIATAFAQPDHATAKAQWRLVADQMLAIGDGGLGFWSALRELFATMREQRCWADKTMNVLNALPKSLQDKAKSHLHDIWAGLKQRPRPAPPSTFSSIPTESNTTRPLPS